MSTSTINRTYGWHPDLPDHRDHTFALTIPPAHLPASMDLRPGCPAPYDQGQLGSCTGNAIAGAIEFDQKKQSLPVNVPSRLFIYYNERVMEGTVSSDAGAQIRDGIKSVNQSGVCPESEWPYLVEKFAVKPTDQCYTDAAKHKAVSYQSVAQNITALKTCLASGFPIVFGFTVYASFEGSAVAASGIVPMPANHEEVLGGHAVLAVGYNDGPQTVGCPSQHFIVRNSWGEGWGAKGYFYMPYQYLTNQNLSSDFWKISVIQ